MRQRLSLLLFALLLLVGLPARQAWAAFDATTVWEVRTTGSDTNGGGFVSSLGGTDYSQQYTPQATGTVTSSTTTVTATTGIFTAAMVGNYITDGTTWKEITAFTNATTVTVDSAPSWTSASIVVGGALASPGKAGNLMVAGNDLYIKAGVGAYSISSATANTAGGCISVSGASNTNITHIIGYQTTRGDGGTKPILQAGAISTFTVVTIGTQAQVENIEVDCVGKTTSKAFSIGGGVATCRAYKCKADNATNGGFVGGSGGSLCLLCQATGCSTTASAAFNGIYCWGCVANGNSTTGFLNCPAWHCIAANNSVATSDGFALTANGNFTWANDTAYNNGRDGFRSGAGASQRVELINDIAESNGGYGYDLTSTFDSFYLYNCAGFGNTSSLVNTSNLTTAQQVGTITCTAEIFVNAAGNNFALNNTAGGGAACRAAGLLGAFPGLSTTSYQDVGAAQHQDSGGGGTARRHR